MATGKPSPASNYHLTEINQPRLDIKKPRAGRPGLLVLIFGQAAWGGVGKPVHLSNQLLAERIVPSAEPASELLSLLGRG